MAATAELGQDEFSDELFDISKDPEIVAKNLLTTYNDSAKMTFEEALLLNNLSSMCQKMEFLRLRLKLTILRLSLKAWSKKACESFVLEKKTE